jgi:hypothetical protein
MFDLALQTNNLEVKMRQQFFIFLFSFILMLSICLFLCVNIFVCSFGVRLFVLQFAKHLNVAKYFDGSKKNLTPEGPATPERVWQLYNSGATLQVKSRKEGLAGLKMQSHHNFIYFLFLLLTFSVNWPPNIGYFHPSHSVFVNWNIRYSSRNNTAMLCGSLWRGWNAHLAVLLE